MNNWKHNGIITNEITTEVFENSTHSFIFEKITNDEYISNMLSCDCMKLIIKDNIYEAVVNFNNIPLNKKHVDSTKLIFINLKNDDGVYHDILKINCKIKKHD